MWDKRALVGQFDSCVVHWIFLTIFAAKEVMNCYSSLKAEEGESLDICDGNYHNFSVFVVRLNVCPRSLVKLWRNRTVVNRMKCFQVLNQRETDA